VEVDFPNIAEQLLINLNVELWNWI